MMKRSRALLFMIVFAGLCAGAAGGARAQNGALATGLAEGHVDITTGFNGAHLSLFGVRNEKGSVAVVISGPRHNRTVRQKSRVAGIWMNTQAAEFTNVPSYYNFALDEDVAKMKDEGFLKAQGIGFPSLSFENAAGGGGPDNTLEPYRQALVRGMQAKGLFPQEGSKVEFIDDRFFRADFYIPAGVPTGIYEIKTFLIRGGQVRAMRTDEVRVARTGLGAWVYDFAQNRSMAYALFCVAFAVFAGWVSNLLRRDT